LKNALNCSIPGQVPTYHHTRENSKKGQFVHTSPCTTLSLSLASHSFLAFVFPGTCNHLVFNPHREDSDTEGLSETGWPGVTPLLLSSHSDLWMSIGTKRPGVGWGAFLKTNFRSWTSPWPRVVVLSVLIRGKVRAKENIYRWVSIWWETKLWNRGI
jgi:hypothetical protein